MRHPLLSALSAILAVLVLVLPASAGYTWCKSDPVISLDGTLVDITVAVPLEYVPAVNGPINIEVKTPKTVQRELVLSDLGYNGHGVVVVFTDGSGVVQDKEFQADIMVEVPVDSSQLAPGEVVPVEVTVLPDNALPVTIEGTSNKTKVELMITGR